jgi:hypothetical protein
MRLLPLCIIALLSTPLWAEAPPDTGDTISAVQRRPLRQAKRVEILPYGLMSIGDPYLQRWGAGLRAMYHLREGLSLGLDLSGTGTWATEDFIIAKRELHARIIDSRQRAALAAMASIAPLYGKVALPGDALVHFETFADVGLGAALTETDVARGVRPLIVAGIGQRIFLSENFALTARVGGNLYAERVKVGNSTMTKAMGFWGRARGRTGYLPGGAR